MVTSRSFGNRLRRLETAVAALPPPPPPLTDEERKRKAEHVAEICGKVESDPTALDFRGMTDRELDSYIGPPGEVRVAGPDGHRDNDRRIVAILEHHRRRLGRESARRRRRKRWRQT